MSEYNNGEVKLDPATQKWIDNNPWFRKDPVLQAAAIGADAELKSRGVPDGPARYRLVEKEIKNRYADKFTEDELAIKPMWEDIEDVSMRKAARQALQEHNQLMKRTGREGLTEEQYLKTYMESENKWR